MQRPDSLELELQVDLRVSAPPDVGAETELRFSARASGAWTTQPSLQLPHSILRLTFGEDQQHSLS